MLILTKRFRALELSVKYKVELENVLAARKYYLEAIHHKETLPKFLDIQANPSTMSAKTKSRKRDKQEKPSKGPSEPIPEAVPLSLVEDEEDKRDLNALE